MPVEAVIARLDAQKTLLRMVDGAVELTAALQTAPKAMPAAYVTPWSERAHPNQLDTGGIEQQVDEQIAVFIAVPNLKDAASGRAALRDQVKPIRSELRNALGGWSPLAGYDPITLGGGKKFALAPGVLWWVFYFNTSSIWRS